MAVNDELHTLGKENLSLLQTKPQPSSPQLHCLGYPAQAYI
jgi:hypothetical protein